MAANEETALLPSNASGSTPSSYYFLQQESNGEGSRNADGGEVLEQVPNGAAPSEFSARRVGSKPSHRKNASSMSTAHQDTFWSKLFGRKQSNPRAYGDVGTLVKDRAVPIKVEPKVFFANERTFLAWLHASVLLAGASMAIVAFADSNPWSQMYGIVLLPVAIAFICYSMYQYARRSAMIRRKDPGPYEDNVGPTVLGIMLMLSITAQFAIKVYSMM